MTLSIVTGCIGRTAITDQWLMHLNRYSAQRHEIIIVSNGSTDAENAELIAMADGLEELDWTVRVIDAGPEPLGTSRAFNTGVKAAHNEIVVCLQNDLLITQPGWDVLVEMFFKEMPRVGVCGMAGGKRIGAPNLYQVPYELHQLARGDVWSSLEDWEVHGKHANIPVDVVVLDGIAMMFRKTVWEATGGLDERYFHHMYDIDFSITVHMSMLKNYVLPIRCKHLNGQTVNVSQVYADAVADRGGDAGVHTESHRLFYDKWRGILPLSIP